MSFLRIKNVFSNSVENLDQVLLKYRNTTPSLKMTIELVSMLIADPNGHNEYVCKIQRKSLEVLEACLAPFCQECGIEISTSSTLKSNEFGITEASEWCDVYLKIPGCALNILMKKREKEQREQVMSNLLQKNNYSLEDAIEFVSAFTANSSRNFDRAMKMTQSHLKAMEACLAPFCQACGIEISTSSTLKSNEFGITEASEWCDVYLKIPANALNILMKKQEIRQAENNKIFCRGKHAVSSLLFPSIEPKEVYEGKETLKSSFSHFSR